MPSEITMPQLTDTMTEGLLVKWLKKEGDAVKAGDIVAEVETDKATMEMESFESGTLLSILIPEGGKAAVGAAIAVVGKAGEKVDAPKKAAPAKAEKKEQAASKPAASTPVGAIGKAVATVELAEDGEAEGPSQDAHKDAAFASATVTSNLTPPNGDSDRLKASPLAKRIAKDLGYDLHAIKGSGPNGRIVQADVLAFKPGAAPSAGKADAALPTRLASGAVEKLPLSKMRSTIASRLQHAKQQIPHIYLSIDIDMEAIASLREKLNVTLEKEKIRISVADFVSKASAVALKQNPAVNAHFDEKNNQIIRYGDVHLGNAVALPDGLIVPVLRSVDQMSIKEIRLRSADLFDRAKKQKLKREEMSGATFTITNLGIWGIKEFQAIVNPPEVAILAVSAMEKRAVVRDGQLVARSTMTVTLSTDHRAVDGATAADFLKSLKTLLEEPALMFI